MTTPRAVLVHPEVPLFYHLVSRCISGAFLCGRARGSRRNYDHRRRWLIDQLMHLARFFAIEVHAYAIMSNHFHITVFYDPTAADAWNDTEVIDRWLSVCPPRLPDGSIDHPQLDIRRTALLASPERIQHCRRQLGSLSTFMKFLKQPIARRANRESGSSGHFFAQRFYSGVLLDPQAVVAACAYVDLNPVRARIARTLEQCRDASISRRLREANVTPEALAKAVGPIVSGLGDRGRSLGIALRDYIARLQALLPSPTPDDPAQLDRWRRQVEANRLRQRAFGPLHLLRNWALDRGLQPREKPMPE